MSTEEFDKCCKGLTNSSQGIKIFKTNLKILSELKAKQEQLKKEALKLQNEMNAFNECMKARVLICLEKNGDKHLNSVRAVNQWFKENYNNNRIDVVLNEDYSTTQSINSTCGEEEEEEDESLVVSQIEVAATFTDLVQETALNRDEEQKVPILSNEESAKSEEIEDNNNNNLVDHNNSENMKMIIEDESEK